MQDDRPWQGDLRRFEASYSPEGLFARYARARVATFWTRQLFPLAAVLPVALLISPAAAVVALTLVVASDGLESLILAHLLKHYPDGRMVGRVRYIPVAATLFQTLGIVAAIGLLFYFLKDGSGHTVLIALIAAGVLNAGLAISHAPKLVAIRLAAYAFGSCVIVAMQFLRGLPPHEILNEAMAMLLLAQLLWLAIADLRRSFVRRVASQRQLLHATVEAEEARRSLAEREADTRRLALVTRHASDSMFFTDNDYRIEYVNETFTQRTGYAEEEVLGKDPRDLFMGTNSDANTLEEISAAIGDRRPFAAEILCYANGGREYWVEFNVSPLFGEDGRPEGYISVSRDVTQAKQREAELRRLSLVAQHANDGVVIAAKSGRIEYVNKAFMRMTGLRQDELDGRTVIGLFEEPITDPGLKQRISESIRRKRPVRAELLLLDRSDGRTWVECSIAPLTDENGELAGHINVSRDISEAKRREAEIDRLSLVARHATDGVVISGADGRIQWVNPTFAARTGLQPDEVVGRAPGELLVSLGSDTATMRRVAEAVSERQHIRTDVRYKSTSGEPIVVETQMTPILADDGSLSGYIAVERDVSEAKQREAELAEAKAVAEEALQAKTRFLATMSHEVRTPLNGIIGTADLLARTALDRDQTDYVDTLVQSGDALLTIVNDILEMTRLEDGRVDLVEAPFYVAGTIEAVVRLMRPAAEGRGLRIESAVSPELSSHFAGDAGRLRQILLNLTGNAIKFTERGEVRLSVTRSDDGMIEFVVTDTGIGIAPDRVEAVFESFAQEDSLTSRRFGGTGLGLTISRMLARTMGGDLVAVSSPGRGSTFTVRLPLRPADAAAEPDSSPVEASRAELLPGSKILVAEDNKANRFLISRFLADAGCEVRFAEDGRMAVEAFADERPDVVLMDVSMPVMDGLAATREIRRLERDGPPCPILGVTANAFEEDRRRCIDAGMTGFVPKPVRRAEVLAALADALHDAPGEATAAE